VVELKNLYFPETLTSSDVQDKDNAVLNRRREEALMFNRKGFWWVPAGSFLLGLVLVAVAGPTVRVFGARAPAAVTMAPCDLVVQLLNAVATATNWQAEGAANGGQLEVNGSYTLLGNTYNTIEKTALDLKFHLILTDASGATMNTCVGDAFGTIASGATAFLFNPDPLEEISEVRTVGITANGDDLIKAINQAADKLNASDPDCNFGIFDIRNRAVLIDKHWVFARLTVTVSGIVNDEAHTSCGPVSAAVDGKVKFNDDGDTKRPVVLAPVE
jgi:hypothetical protein